MSDPEARSGLWREKAVSYYYFIFYRLLSFFFFLILKKSVQNGAAHMKCHNLFAFYVESGLKCFSTVLQTARFS